MAEQDLHDAEVNALFEQAGGKAVAERMAGERVAEQALLTCNANRLADRVVRNVTRCVISSREDPLLATMQLPSLPQHLKSRFAQWNDAFLVPLADNPQQHLLGVDRRDWKT